MLSRATHLFRQADAEGYVTVDTVTGKARPMDPARFASWAESVVWPYRTGRDGPTFARMPRETAGLVLACDAFRDHVRQLRGINQVRLPVWQGPPGQGEIRLLPAGWDEESGFYTLDAVPYDLDQDPREARQWFIDTFNGFPFADERSRASLVMLMLSPFIRGLMPSGERMLHGLIIANQARSGKSLLAQAVLAPVHGEAAAQSLDGNPKELRATLDAIALEQAQYCWLDDMGDLRNRTLNAFLTAPRYKCRVLGFTKTAEARVETLCIITGNGLDVGPEIAARCVIVDLWLDTDAAARKFRNIITPGWLASTQTRAASLSFLWASVRNWTHHKKPLAEDATRPGFEAHASLAGSIVRAMLLGNPFTPRPALLGGDEESLAIRGLLTAAAERSWPEGREWRPQTMLELAEELGLLDTICPWSPNQNLRQSLGHKLKLWRGRRLQDGQGRLFEFGRRGGHGGAIYPLRWITE